MDKAKIIVVGAGPTGLTAAILLRQRGYAPVVLDRRAGPTSYPAAHVANTRTIEILAEMGVAEQVWETGDTNAMSSLVVWLESMAGREYGILPIKGAVHDDRGPLSAYRSVNIPQTKLEAILYERLVKLGGAVRYNCEVSDVREEGSQVFVSLKAEKGSEQSVLTCDWVLGCDGASSQVRRSIGIDMIGPKTIARFMTIYFEADLDRYRTNRKALLYWIGGPAARGVFICFDEVGRKWAMLVPIGDLAVDSFSDMSAIRIVQKAIGDLSAPITLNAVSSWNMSAQVATDFRRGRVLLAGDACHRFPPTGGLGMNTGIQDAHNLIWKLSAVIDCRAPETLLDTYEVERRPIAQRNTAQSVHNLQKMGMIDAALGIATLAPVAADAGEGPITIWPAELLGIDDGIENAAERRAQVQGAIDEQSEHFAQGAGLDLGFSYAQGAFVPDGSQPPSISPSTYRPDAHPGARLPFSSPDGRFQSSTLASVDGSAITLFAQDLRWAQVAALAADSSGCDIKTVFFGEGARDFGPMASDLLGITKSGAVAVRPDGHVLWRARAWIESAGNDLAHAATICFGIKTDALDPIPAGSIESLTSMELPTGA
jgi:2,4-dichlorophenol 6-monooxygenase